MTVESIKGKVFGQRSLKLYKSRKRKSVVQPSGGCGSIAQPRFVI